MIKVKCLRIEHLTTYLLNPLNQKKYDGPAKALIEAINLVMKNNIINFENITVKQLIGIAVGISPAPPITNLYVAIDGTYFILEFLDSWIPFPTFTSAS